MFLPEVIKEKATAQSTRTNYSNASESESDHADDDGLTEITSALDNIISVFREPLQAKGCNFSSIVDEIEEIIEYARKYLNISKEGYQKIFTAPDSGRWASILLICELIFSLPFSNGHIERTFSALKLIKTDRRTSLDTSTLSDLLDITVEGPELGEFSAEQAVDLWWNDTTSKRPKQSTRKQYKVQKCSTSKGADNTSESDDDDSFALTLDDWTVDLKMTQILILLMLSGLINLHIIFVDFKLYLIKLVNCKHS